VSSHNYGRALFINIFEKLDDTLTCRGIEVACWLVRDDDRRIIDERPGKRDLLLLSLRGEELLLPALLSSGQTKKGQDFSKLAITPLSSLRNWIMGFESGIVKVANCGKQVNCFTCGQFVRSQA